MSLLSVKNVGKAFRTYRSEWHRFANWFGFNIKPAEEHWVLRHINFEVNAGESIGIIGQNGAGKSTLLKMITGTLQPSEGVVNITGRIAAILELGIGFNPDLTGRQNAFHAAGLMGFDSIKIESIMPEIEEFAEIGEYFDNPVRTYSSGMQMRVAFAVATVDMPELLIVDEALSVGDSYFQHKCIQRLKSYKKAGCSLLFVSHDISAIKNICDRAILIANGQTMYDGKPEDAFDYYNALIAQQHPESYLGKENSQAVSTQGTRSGTGELKISSVSISGINDKAIIQNTPVNAKVVIQVEKVVEQWCVGLSIKDRFGNDIFGTNTGLLEYEHPKLIKGNEIEVVFTFPDFIIGPGSYSFSIAVHDLEGHVKECFDWWDKAAVFDVIEPENITSAGICFMNVGCQMMNMNKISDHLEYKQ